MDASSPAATGLVDKARAFGWTVGRGGMDVSRYGTFLKAWRVYRGLSQEEAAARVGMTKGNLSQLERGLIGYTQSTLERLADVYHCSPSELIDRHPEEAEQLWRLIRQMGPTDRRRLSNVAESFVRSGWDAPEDQDQPAPGRDAARAIGRNGGARDPEPAQ